MNRWTDTSGLSMYRRLSIHAELGTRIDTCQYMNMRLPRCCPPASEPALDDTAAGDLAAVLKAIADPVRLRLISMLSLVDEQCACDFVDSLGVSQPTVSHHLKVLADAGLISRRKQGRWVYYRLERSELAALSECLQPAT